MPIYLPTRFTVIYSRPIAQARDSANCLLFLLSYTARTHLIFPLPIPHHQSRALEMPFSYTLFQFNFVYEAPLIIAESHPFAFQSKNENFIFTIFPKHLRINLTARLISIYFQQEKNCHLPLSLSLIDLSSQSANSDIDSIAAPAAATILLQSI